MTEQEQKLIGLLASIAVQPCETPKKDCNWTQPPTVVMRDCDYYARFNSHSNADGIRGYCLPCKASVMLSKGFGVRVSSPEPQPKE